MGRSIINIFLLLAILFGVSGFLWWKRGVPYQDRVYSPNGAYYV